MALVFILKKENRNVLRKWFDFVLRVCVCVPWMPFWNINNDSKFVFNSFLIYVHVQPHSCVQYVHMDGYFEVKCFPDKQKNRPRTRKKNIIANSAKKSIIKLKLYGNAPPKRNREKNTLFMQISNRYSMQMPINFAKSSTKTKIKSWNRHREWQSQTKKWIYFHGNETVNLCRNTIESTVWI